MNVLEDVTERKIHFISCQIEIQEAETNVKNLVFPPLHHHLFFYQINGITERSRDVASNMLNVSNQMRLGGSMITMIIMISMIIMTMAMFILLS